MKPETTTEPLYEKVKAHVLGQLAEGKWEEGRKLPSENELVAELGVSRMTVNRALRELMAEGHVMRVQGLGTFAAPKRPQAALIEINDIAEEIRARGGHHRAEVLLLETFASPGPDLLAQFEAEADLPIAHSVVLHFENDQPALLEERFVNATLAPHYIEQDFAQTTTYDYLSKRVPLTEVEHVISAIPAEDDIAALLEVEARSACIHLFRRTWWNGAVVTVNNFTYAGNRIALASRYQPASVRSGLQQA
ncbi:histidine utilization repressor [Rhizobium alvei]|uniref:Histidine utilization repressor n=1 Tax=Rhizobium alvei TaxID=1132659 RepID=A0ABT8YIP8_9HYPH|nr:histidine utilization repressor [Rhizobium alvei]MDO6963574.1 histidine utilization repressor [Rhizobium alvei]